MKYFWTLIKYVPLILLFCMTCVYTKITHMSDSDLEWVTHRYVGETMAFESNKGDMDIVVVTNIEIDNLLNPINLNPGVGDNKYIAHANIEYVVFHDTDSLMGALRIEKHENGEPIWISSNLDSRYTFDTMPFSVSSLDTQLGLLTDCVYFDGKNSKLDIDNIQTNPIQSFIWSKKYGLVQYSFKDGTKYVRKWNK